MENKFKTFSGKCLCGKVEVSFMSDVETFGACHCGMCRKWSGGSALAVQGGPDVKFTGEQHISVYDSSAWAQRGFCKSCGTHLFYRLKAGGFINFPLGLLENVDHLNFNMQIFIDKKPENYSFANTTEQLTELQVLKKYGYI